MNHNPLSSFALFYLRNLRNPREDSLLLLKIKVKSVTIVTQSFFKIV
jgi:hypothetical protein